MGGQTKTPKVDTTQVVSEAQRYRPPTAADLGLSAQGQGQEVRGGGAAPSQGGATTSGGATASGAAGAATSTTSGGPSPGATQGGVGGTTASGATGGATSTATTGPTTTTTPASGGGGGGGGGGTASPTPAPTGNAARWAEIERLCNLSALGREALQRKSTYSVGINYAAGTGSFYSSSSNAMTLDTTETFAESALTFVHEMNHAHYHHAGLGANVQTMTRQQYVDAMLNEEVEGTILSIEAKGEISASGEAISATFPLEAEYHAAYQAAIAAGQNAAAARTAARQRVRQGFQNGEVVTSNTGVSYPDYYGNYWDSVHPSSGGGSSSGGSWV